jgi:hypothetical protein
MGSRRADARDPLHDLVRRVELPDRLPTGVPVEPTEPTEPTSSPGKPKPTTPPTMVPKPRPTTTVPLDYDEKHDGKHEGKHDNHNRDNRQGPKSS